MAGKEPADLYGTYGSVPTAAPSDSGVSGPLQVSSTPNTFGAQVGEAQQQKGAGEEKLGQDISATAEKFQDMYNTSSAREITMGLSQKIGDAELQFKQNRGLNAASAYPVFQQQIKGLMDSTTKSINNPMVREMVLNEAQHEVDLSYTRAGAWTADQVERGQLRSIDASMTGRANMLAANITDPASVKDYLAGIQSDVAQYAHVQGMSLEDADSMLSHSTGEGIQAGIRTLLYSDPAKAAELYSQFKDASFSATRTGPDGTQTQIKVPYLDATHRAMLAAEMAPALEEADVSGVINHGMDLSRQEYLKTLNGGQGSTSPLGMGGDYSAKVQKIEGTGPNTSGGTSSGKYQFNDSTWLSTVRKFAPEMADKSDADVMSMKGKDDSFKDKMFRELTIDNKGILAQKIGHAPSDADVYLAHQQGASGAAALINNPSANAAALVGLGQVKNNLPTAMRQQAEAMTAGDFVKHWEDKFGQTLAAPPGPGVPAQNYAKNDHGTIMTYPDYLATHSYEDTQRLRNWAENVRPGDNKFSNTVVARSNAMREQLIHDQTNTYHQAMSSVMSVITGASTNGKIPATVDELYADPKIASTLSTLASADKDSQNFVEKLPDTLSRYQKRNFTDYSTNGANAAMRVLLPAGESNGIQSQFSLDKLFGTNSPEDINGKDHELLTKFLAAEDDPNFKKEVSARMKNIQQAGDNLDGEGGVRSMRFLETAMKLKESPNGDKSKLSLHDLEGWLDKAAAHNTISRAEQAANLRDMANNGKLKTFSSPDDPEYQNLPSGAKFLTTDGLIGTKR